MTQMPELVALMHSLVGLAACLVGFASYIDTSIAVSTGAEKAIHEVEIYIGVLIGAVTFSGSVIAFGKLSGKISGKPLLLPGAALAQPRRPAGRDLFRLRCSCDAETASRPACMPLIVMTVDRAAVRRPHGDGHRRRRHAGRGVDAQQLLRLGRGGHRLHAVATTC